MDSQIELAFLEVLDQHKQSVLSKDGTKDGKDSRAQAWEDVQKSLLINTSKDFKVGALKTKWNNIQSRVKDKMKSAKETGGGESSKFSMNDRLAIKIMGEDNPKLCKVPGSVENLKRINTSLPDLNESLSTTESNAENVDPNPESLIDTPTAPPLKKLKKASFQELSYEVMELEKEKLSLEIQVLKKKLVEKSTKATQTVQETPSFSAGGGYFGGMMGYNYQTL